MLEGQGEHICYEKSLDDLSSRFSTQLRQYCFKWSMCPKTEFSVKNKIYTCLLRWHGHVFYLLQKLLSLSSPPG